MTAFAITPMQIRRSIHKRFSELFRKTAIILLLLPLIAMTACNPTDTQVSESSGQSEAANPITNSLDKGIISLDDYASYTGQYVEDGKNEQVSNVAAIRVTNNSDSFLDLATVTVNIDGKAASFIVTGLPAGRSAWVLEAARMTVNPNASFKLINCVTSYREGVIAKSDKVTVNAEGNVLSATNHTDEPLENVFVYYRTLHTDGYFLGGITYYMDFGTIEPGGTVSVTAGHYSEGLSEIVRVGWKGQ